MPSLEPHIGPQSILVFLDPSGFESLAPPNLCAFFSNNTLKGRSEPTPYIQTSWRTVEKTYRQVRNL